MEIFNVTENFTFTNANDDSEFEFTHTSIFIRDPLHNAFFYASSPVLRDSDVWKADISTFKLEPIKRECICPTYDPTYMTVAPGALTRSSECFVKFARPYLYCPDSLNGKDRDRLQLEQEIGVFEALLRAPPHPNVARYHGVIVDCDKVVGLCFNRYEMSLAERIADDSLGMMDVDAMMRDIGMGVQHLHNDLNEYNIMMDKNDRAIIVDLDSSSAMGQWSDKSGSLNNKRKWGTTEADWDAVAEIENALRKETSGR